jgi:hypothetical protein
MALEERIKALRDKVSEYGNRPVPKELQGVNKDRIRQVLALIDRNTPDIVDAVFALLDDTCPSWFSSAPEGTKFFAGASTAHIACHIGILQRDGRKLDREGRDYWIKPLRDVGAIEPVTLVGGQFIAGHPIAKSSNSSYRLAADFLALLKAPEDQLEALARAWVANDAVRQRLEFQARAAEEAKALVDTKHSDLIQTAVRTYAPHFLPGYKVLFVDDGDGERIPEAARERIKAAGIEILLADAMPDILLWNPETGDFWVIEAVTSDGEVDLHKVAQVQAFIRRSCPNAQIGFTTAYRTWRDAAARQAKHKNLAPGSSLWIQEDPSKELLVKSMSEDDIES